MRAVMGPVQQHHRRLCSIHVVVQPRQTIINKNNNFHRRPYSSEAWIQRECSAIEVDVLSPPPRLLPLQKEGAAVTYKKYCITIQRMLEYSHHLHSHSHLLLRRRLIRWRMGKHIITINLIIIAGANLHHRTY